MKIRFEVGIEPQIVIILALMKGDEGSVAPLLLIAELPIIPSAAVLATNAIGNFSFNLTVALLF